MTRNGPASQQRKNLRVIAPCMAVIGVMIGLVAYSPKLYRMFCAATGFGGTTQRVDADTATVSPQTVMVAFDASVAPDLPWRFEPKQRAVTVHLGEQKLVYFTAENLGNTPIVAHATYNVSPNTTGAYFNKIQCFCFNEERLDAHEKVDMPVVFYVDPAFGNDPEMRHVSTITLGYTFFRSANPQQAKDLSRFLADAAPDPAHGEELFGERCTACHALTRNKYGPMLGGVFGRKAGSVAGYRYSPALQQAGFTWSAATLDRWLADPQGFVPGARMPVRVLDPPSRRDLIAYLKKESPLASGKPPTRGSGS